MDNPLPPPDLLPGQLDVHDPLHTFLTHTLGFPSDASVFIFYRDALEELDSRLAGFRWEMIGCLVPPTRELPDYPTYRMGWRPGHPPLFQFQLRHWGVRHLASGLFGEMRWQPETGMCMTIGGFQPQSSQEAREHIWRALQISIGYHRRGPPRKSAEEKRLELSLAAQEVRRFYRRYKTIPALQDIVEALMPRVHRKDPKGHDELSFKRRVSRLRVAAGYLSWEAFARASLAQPDDTFFTHE